MGAELLHADARCGRSDPERPIRPISRRRPVKPEKTDIGWEIDSAGLSHVVKDLYARYDLPECYITENGAAYNMGRMPRWHRR